MSLTPILVPASGPTRSKFFVIGEAPGATEAREGRPFCGQSGELLDEALLAVGLDRSEVYVTNAFKEYRVGNPTPSLTDIRNHRPHIFEELESVRPRAVLTLGNPALYSATNARRITQARGTWDFTLRLHIPVMPTYHPAYVLRQGGRGSAAHLTWLHDIDRWANYARKGT